MPGLRRARRALLVALGSLAVAVLGAEGVLRWTKPPFLRNAGLEALFDDENLFHPRQDVFVVDPEIGFVPRLGKNDYSELGTVKNDYPREKRPGVERLLFLGDSATHRGQIQKALAKELDGDRYELWNAGVEGYNTHQEVVYYRRYGAPLDPDHVILTFHLNDFQVTPVLFVDGDGQLVVFAPWRPCRVNPWFYRYSYVYRMMLAGMIRGYDDGSAFEEVSAEIEKDLLHLRAMTDASGARLTVLVLPVLGTFDDLPPSWRPESERRKARIREILTRNGLRFFDLTEPHERALADGYPVRESRLDSTHPNGIVAKYFADYLLENGLLSNGS